MRCIPQIQNVTLKGLASLDAALDGSTHLVQFLPVQDFGRDSLQEFIDVVKGRVKNELAANRGLAGSRHPQLEHESVAEAAVVPSPDPIRLAIPKAYVLLVSGAERSPETALSIFRHLHTRLAPFKRIRRIELVTELPKTISGKIRRVQLRRLEHDNDRGDALRGKEFREEDFPELQKVRPAGSAEN